MNAIPNNLTAFSVNPTIDLEALATEFRLRSHLRICNILEPRSALALYKYLARQVAWRPAVFCLGRLLAGAAAPAGSDIHPLDQQARQRAYEGRERGSAYLLDVDRLFPEDVPQTIPFDNGRRTALLEEFAQFLNSELFLDLLRTICGNACIERVEIQATRHRRGHFSSFLTLPASLGDLSAVEFGFDLTLTLEWSSDWGGALTFRGRDLTNSDGYVPAFNTLDLFALPQGHWIGAVSDFAAGERLAIAGRVYTRKG